MATTTFTPSMLRGAGTRGVPEIPAGSSYSNTYSFDFDGTDDFIDCGNITALNGVTEATWMGWFNRAGSGLYNLFTTYGATTTTRQFAAQGSSSTLTTYMANSGGTQKTMNKINYSFSVDTWYYLAFVYN